jgi:putative ABC transport system ATP-binding protein
MLVTLQPSTQLAIEAHSFEFRYSRAQPPVVCLPEWRVAAGEQLFLRGASGTGKSTLLQLLCGLRVGTGKLSIAGTNLSELSSAKRDSFRARHIGVVFQQFNLIPYLSMLENVVVAASLAGRAYAASAERAKFLLEEVGLSETLWRQQADTLSIGQQQRVAIARALINIPQLLLLDEPTSALDEANQARFMAVLTNHLETHPTTVVFVSHDLRLAKYFERSVTLAELSPVNENGACANAH